MRREGEGTTNAVRVGQVRERIPSRAFGSKWVYIFFWDTVVAKPTEHGPTPPSEMISKTDLIKIVGAITLVVAVSPFLYTRLDNVKNTGNKAFDTAAEFTHDVAVNLMSFIVVARAIGFFITFLIVLRFIPNSVFKEKEVKA